MSVSECTGEPERHEQPPKRGYRHLPRAANPELPDLARQHIRNEQIERSPCDVGDRTRVAQRAWEWSAGDAVRQMRNSVHPERAAGEVRDVVVPEHRLPLKQGRDRVLTTRSIYPGGEGRNNGVNRPGEALAGTAREPSTRWVPSAGRTRAFRRASGCVTSRTIRMRNSADRPAASTVENSIMRRIPLGILLGIVIGAVDVLLMLPLAFPDKRAALAGAFVSRFSLGFFAATVQLPVSPVLAGMIVGLLTSVPDAIITKAYVPIMISGIVFGAVAGWIVGRCAR